jgi:two-component system cell cycle sensor histidine kinase/response regulator CckA
VQSLKILHLEDSTLDAELVTSQLSEAGMICEFVRVDTEAAFREALEKGDFDMIISDFSMPGFDGRSALSIARERNSETPFIFVSGTIGEEAAIESLLAGATDYVLKHQFSRLVPAIRRAQSEAEQRRERKRIEAQLLRTQRMESIGTLAGGIAHDLNNILTPILMAVQLLRERVSDPGTLRLIDTLETSARRGANIVRQVLTFARGVEGEHIPIQPKHLISNMEKMLTQTFPKSIEIRSELPRNLWMVIGDPTHFDQVLLNLCVNARDAMPDGGTLTIRAQNTIIDEHYVRLNLDARPGPYVVIEIADNGHGIPPHLLDKIFEPFFTTKDVGKGTGLGLSTVIAIVKSHKGFIHVYSEPGNGTSFKVFLPAQESAHATQTLDAIVNLPRGNDELILVVDDEQAVREIARATLESYGYRTLVASNGAEALELYAQDASLIHAVLLDMVMPIMDGHATIRALRTINPQVRIIAASGLLENARNANLLSEDGSCVRAVLAKPYTAEKLLTTLRKVIES